MTAKCGFGGGVYCPDTELLLSESKCVKSQIIVLTEVLHGTGAVRNRFRLIRITHIRNRTTDADD